MQKDVTMKMADGTILNLRFDMGTARKIKELSGVDPMGNIDTEDWYDYAATTFAAAYMRACKVFKTAPALTVAELKDYFDELTMNEAVQLMQSFNGAMTVVATPEVVAALKEAEKAATEATTVEANEPGKEAEKNV